MKLIKNINLILPDKVIENGSIEFDQEIEGIYKTDMSRDNEYEEIIDGQGGYLSPGLINIHIHGAGGHDTMEASYQALDTMSETVAQHGVTGFLPTTMTMSEEEIKDALKNIENVKEKGVSGAEILGANVEGPFISPDNKGAQDEKNIIPPDFSLISNYLDLVKLITIAPERDGAKEFIEKVTEKGIVASVGHSVASMEDVNKAKHWGLSHATHLFNAMTGLHHRNPGIVGAVLLSNITSELIADYIHVNPSVLRLVTEMKDTEDIILITDAMEAAGLEDGEYELGGQKVTVKDGSARLSDGTLAGSVLTMNKAVKNMYNAANLPLNKVINMATLNPARVINLDHRIGKLAEGYKADLTLFDENLEVESVYNSGEQIV